jgi:hypothetical protein
MSMNWPRRHRTGVLGWGTLALGMIGLAWVLHAALPQEPRWVVRGPLMPLGLAHDGTTVMTAMMSINDLPNRNRSPAFPSTAPRVGPVQFWDVATGSEAWSVLDDGWPRWQIAFSEDFRQLAAVAQPHEGAGQDELRLIDLKTGQERRTQFEHSTDYLVLSFSPGNALLVLEDWSRQHDVKDICLYDTGSLRLLARAPPPIRWPRWRWSADGTALLLYTTDKKGGATLRRVSADGETSVVLHGAGDWLEMSPDGKTLLTEPPPRDGEDHTRIGTILRWDLPGGASRGAIPTDSFHPRASSENLLFTADSRTLLITMGEPRPGNTLGAWDLEQGQWLGRIALPPNAMPYLPGPNAVLIRNQRGKAPLSWYRLRPFGRLWQRDVAGGALHELDHLPGGEQMVTLSGEGGGDRLQVLDGQTGHPTLDITLDPQAHNHLLVRGEHLAVVTEYPRADERGAIREFIEEHLRALVMPRTRRSDRRPTSTRFFDIATGGERCCIDHPGADPQMITADGRALIVYQQAGPDGEAAVICYDVPPRRPWQLIVGVPFVIGVLLVVMRFGWHRWRVQPRAAAAALSVESSHK